MADDLRYWEDLVNVSEIHYGGDILTEILNFFRIWDIRIFYLYFGDAFKAAAMFVYQENSDVALELYRLINKEFYIQKNF